MIKEAQEKQNPHQSLPGLISKAQDVLVKLDVREMQEVIDALRPFVWEGRPKSQFVKSGIML
jgi:hypothetical protein